MLNVFMSHVTSKEKLPLRFHIELNENNNKNNKCLFSYLYIHRYICKNCIYYVLQYTIYIICINTYKFIYVFITLKYRIRRQYKT